MTKGVSAEDQLRDILIQFLKQVEPRPTWKVIIEALRSPSVNLPALVKDLEDDSTICDAPELKECNTGGMSLLALSRISSYAHASLIQMLFHLLLLMMMM